MSYAIRFLPRDPRDPSPALYASVDASLTSVPCDVREFSAVDAAFYMRPPCAPSIARPCRNERLIADVVPLSAALADCADVEARP